MDSTSQDIQGTLPNNESKKPRTEERAETEKDTQDAAREEIQSEETQNEEETPQESFQAIQSVALKLPPPIVEKTWIKALRTYKTDAQEMMKKQRGSITRIVLSERRKKGLEEKEKPAPLASLGEKQEIPFLEVALEKSVGEETEKENLFSRFKIKIPKPLPLLFPRKNALEEKEDTAHVLQKTLRRRKIAGIAVSILLTGAGVGIAYGAYLLIVEREVKPSFVLLEEIITTDAQKEIALADLTEREIAEKVREEKQNNTLSFNQVESIYFTKKIPLQGTIDFGGARFGVIGVRELFFIMRNNIPSPLLRSLNDQDFLFGIHALDAPHAFLVLKIDSFETAFSGMLKWERHMFEDVTSLFGLNPETRFTNKTFKDVVIKNRDARILTDENGKIVLMYSFIDNETMVITASEETFDEVATRLKAPKKILR